MANPYAQSVVIDRQLWDDVQRAVRHAAECHNQVNYFNGGALMYALLIQKLKDARLWTIDRQGVVDDE